MDREKLNDFVVLAETLSFSEAAEQRYISQSALSKRIRSLEKDLGEPLIDRSSRSIRLTEFGEGYLPYAKQILVAYDSADRFQKTFHQTKKKQVTLGSVINPECFHVYDIYMEFSKKYPEVSLNLREEPLLKLEQLFQDRVINLYCTSDTLLRKGTPFLPVGEGYVAVICMKDDPLSALETISPQDLADRNLLLPAEMDPFTTAIHTAFRGSGIEPHVVYQGAAVSGLSLLKNGIGVAILPVEIAAHYASDDMCVLPFSPAIRYYYGLGYRERSELTEPERAFVDFLRDNYQMK